MKDIVTQDDVPPAGRPGECFWCRAKMGEPHKHECSTQNVPVEVEITIRGVITVPRSWDRDMIEFHMNESSNCLDNQIEEIIGGELGGDACTCEAGEGRYIRHVSIVEAEREKHLLEKD